MALRLKILMASGSKKGTQIYFSFLSKVPANEPPPGSPTGPLWRGRTVYRAFCISLKNLIFRVPSVKESSLKVPLMESLVQGCPTATALRHSSIRQPSVIHLSESTVYEPPPPPTYQVPLGWKGAPHGERCPYPETFLTYLPGSPVKELPLRSPPRCMDLTDSK